MQNKKTETTKTPPNVQKTKEMVSPNVYFYSTKRELTFYGRIHQRTTIQNDDRDRITDTIFALEEIKRPLKKTNCKLEEWWTTRSI